MLELLGNHTGPININGKDFPSLKEAEEYLSTYKGGLTVTIGAGSKKGTLFSKSPATAPKEEDSVWFRMEVKYYMVQYTPDFFLHTLNSEGPMPFIFMIGRRLEETEKLIKMECYPDIFETRTTRCIRCGGNLYDPISQRIGLCTECGGSKYIKMLRDGSDIEHVRATMSEEFRGLKWTGWVVKDAILRLEQITNFVR